MARGDGDLWRTLVLLYSVVLAAAVCVPSTTVLPLLLGVDSLLVFLCAGGVGLGLTTGVVFLLVGRYDAFVARSERAADDDADSRGTADADATMPGQAR